MPAFYIYSYNQQQFLLIITMSVSFVFMVVAVIRIYARVFLAQHTKGYHSIACRSF